MTADGLLSTRELCEASGIPWHGYGSSRCVELYARDRILIPVLVAVGSGTKHRWHPREIVVARAVLAARDWLDQGHRGRYGTYAANLRLVAAAARDAVSGQGRWLMLVGDTCRQVHDDEAASTPGPRLLVPLDFGEPCDTVHVAC